MRQNMFVRKSSDEKQTIHGFLYSSDLSKYRYNQLVKTYENECFFFFFFFIYTKYIFVTSLVLQSFEREQECSSIPLWTFDGG